MRPLLVLFLIVCSSCRSQMIEETKTPDLDVRAETYLSFLASDELRGRDTGSPGIEKAAGFIEKVFKASDIKPFFQTYRDSFRIKDLDAYNIVGLIEGNDPKLKKEHVLIGAHYDHMGLRARVVDMDTIANGANDNATGTVAVMLLAEKLRKSRSNKRSLIFALFSGEEMGLKGSEHLSKRLKDQGIDLYTVVNFEMVGVPLIDRDYSAFISGYSMSNMAKKINEYIDKNLLGESALAKKYDLFKRSDNYPFYLDFLIPSHTIAACDLSNYDYYHHVDDEAEKMDYDFMTRLIEDLAPAIEAMSNSETKEIILYGE